MLSLIAAAPLLLLLGAAAPSAAPSPGTVEVKTAQAFVRVSVPAAGTFRVVLSRTADFPALPSFAVDPAVLSPGAPYTVDTSDPAAVVVRTASSALRVAKDPLHLALLDAQGAVLSEEAALTWGERGARIAWTLGASEHVYGLGDKVKGFDRRGQKFALWNYDAYGWSPTSDALYKSIPFLLFADGPRAHGLFIDDPSRAAVDVGASDPGQVRYAAERAPVLDLYLFAGPDPKGVIGAYTALTGRAPLPPRWALGYHQCRYSYRTEDEARSVAKRLRADSIPADAIWFDIDYQQGHAPFTVDASAFPHFGKMISDFASSGLRTVVITDPHLKNQESGYEPYASGAAGDHFIHAPSGGLYEDNVWPGASVFPEFTLSRTRSWWGGLYKSFIDEGIAGFWDDMNEPAVFNADKTMPDATPHRLDDGRTTDHVAIHNAWGLLNARATYEGELSLRPGARPFVLTRAGYASGQRWGATWTGDNGTSWDHLAVTIPQLTNLGVSGWSFVGADIGGFTGCPDAALMTEWMELAAFQPFFRNHSQGKCYREPWKFGAAAEKRMRAAIERRYRLMPYLYAAFEESSRTGLPVMRPLWLEYPADASTAANDRAFLVGRDLLVAPRLGARSPYEVTLPAADWWDTSTGALVPGGGAVKVAVPANESLRIFARAGAIIATQPLVQQAAATPKGALTLDVWPGQDCGGALYLDDGQSFDYQRGAFRRIAYACQAGPRGIHITATSTGSYPAWWSSTQVVLHGVPSAAAYPVSSNDTPLPSRYDPSRRTLTVTLAGGGSDWAIAATW